MIAVAHDSGRSRLLARGHSGPGPVIYWMSRDQRVRDNWALLSAQRTALVLGRPLLAVFCLVPGFLGATIRQYGFMLRGLSETEAELRKLGVGFHLLRGDPVREIVRLTRRLEAAELVTDFDPLRLKRRWVEGVTTAIQAPFRQVDAHNVVPCWQASAKAEYGARTLRPRIHRLLGDYLTPLPAVRRHPHRAQEEEPPVNWDAVRRSLRVDRTIAEVSWLTPGEKAAARQLDEFLTRRLRGYAENRNDPNCAGQSCLSPYLHFGQVSAQRVAWEVQNAEAPDADKAAFLEELVIRHELSDNFCFYSDAYDSVEGFPAWARTTLDEHRSDPRDAVYSRAQFEQAETHDDLWNAAQTEMVQRGKMHGYLRMYWAKKILEWSKTPEDALETAVYLNDRYELDGRDPNGYAGIAWSIGGVHDRAWPSRPVFGKVRYMSLAGCRRKFDVRAYVAGVMGRDEG